MVEAHQLAPLRILFLLHEAVQRLLDAVRRLWVHGAVHQAMAGVADQVPALLQDVECHRNGHHRIEPEPASHLHQRYAGHHADGGPDVGTQMAPVGLQRDRIVNLGRLEQHPGANPVEHGTRQGKRHAPAELLQRLRIHQTVDRGPENAQRGSKDQHALEAGREILGLVVAMRMVLVGGALGDRHHHQGEHGTGQVDEGLHGIGQQADRAGHVPGQGLENDGQDGGRSRHPEQGLGAGEFHGHSVRQSGRLEGGSSVKAGILFQPPHPDRVGRQLPEHPG